MVPASTEDPPPSRGAFTGTANPPALTTCASVIVVFGSDSEASRTLQSLVLGALQREPMFLSAALPRRIFPPRFNRYRAPGERYGAHIDNAILRAGDGGQWLRADLSCTVFLSDPASYDGGDLVVHDRLGVQHFRHRGDVADHPADKGIDDVNRRNVQEDPLRPIGDDALRQLIL